MTPPRDKYAEIIRHYADLIGNGTLPPGTLLPAVRAIANEWGTNKDVVSRALSRLAAENLIITRPKRRAVVRERAMSAPSPQARILSVHKTGKIYPAGDKTKVVLYGFRDAPAEVASLLNVAPGELAYLRTRVNYDKAGRPLRASTSWIAQKFAEPIRDALMSSRPIVGGTIRLVEESSGLRAVRGLDGSWARLATDQEREWLDLAHGSAVTEGRNCWYAQDGQVLELGVFVLPPYAQVTHEYVI